MDWYLLRVAPQRQGRYVDYMGRFCPDVELYYPVYRKIVRPHGVRRPVVRELPVFPGYVFGRVENGIHRMAERDARLVRFGDYYGIVQDVVIEGLKKLECTNQLVREVEKVSPYRVGVRVRIHLSAGDLIGVITRVQSVQSVCVDIGKCRALVPIHSLEICT